MCIAAHPAHYCARDPARCVYFGVAEFVARRVVFFAGADRSCAREKSGFLLASQPYLCPLPSSLPLCPCPSLVLIHRPAAPVPLRSKTMIQTQACTFSQAQRAVERQHTTTSPRRETSWLVCRGARRICGNCRPSGCRGPASKRVAPIFFSPLFPTRLSFRLRLAPTRLLAGARVA